MVTVVVAAVYKIAESKIRRMVCYAGVNALFGEARETVEAGLPSPMPAIGFIDSILETDREAPRKQRYTAHRI